VRQQGMILAIEMVRDKARREPYDFRERRGLAAYRYALEHEVLLRPVGDVLYFMPPYVITTGEIDLLARVAEGAIGAATCG
jgi:adenosylmethionine-8-amino-7-oxononanoate aminotransferase